MPKDSILELQEKSLMKGTQVPWHAEMSLRHWFPVSVQLETGDIVWRKVSEERFTAPFFVDTLHAQPHQSREFCISPASALQHLPAAIPLSGFIFHASRCGSTLISQCLIALPETVVMSEPPIVDAVLRNYRHDPIWAIELLRQVILALAQKTRETDRHFFIKLDSWHIHDIALIQRAFPGVPCIYLARDPLAILKSHYRARGPQMIPGVIAADRLALLEEDMSLTDFNVYTARVLAGYFQAATRAALKHQLLILDYRQLLTFIFDGLIPFFQMDCDDEDAQKMRSRVQFHAKKPYETFVGDQDVNQPSLDACTSLVMPAYRALMQAKSHTLPGF